MLKYFPNMVPHGRRHFSSVAGRKHPLIERLDGATESFAHFFPCDSSCKAVQFAQLLHGLSEKVLLIDRIAAHVFLFCVVLVGPLILSFLGLLDELGPK